ncbi:hypothetical protein P153DRAFT_303226 [Dothidotthia symphoricarpi CBS 119687]|uniref:Mitochondrial carrier n=1 Tax=Dothidotthia symphoricarpi CBS 119687 TaxID=1392245 RepID=A0A6A5ZXV0_9PLEO|nr:uncharacterized protein P153DRAFT_303226 [Dothidotthia symphoricarpi CBS 119687]KAF2123845.1 hypothetical protein P153DRAFT_303226 [Dothidotthia symphoricarpi CBS 119687]
MTRVLHTPLVRLAQPTIARRTFWTTPALRIKEDGNRSPEELEKAKQDQLQEQKEGKGRWKEELASSGESNIAADKHEVDDHGSHIKELQKEGKEMGDKGQI